MLFSTMKKKGIALILLLPIGIASALHAGFTTGTYFSNSTTPYDFGAAETSWEVGEVLLTDDNQTSYTDKARLVRGAAALLKSALQSSACSISGGSGGSKNDDIVNLLDSMLANNQFCGEHAKMAKHHTTRKEEAAAWNIPGGIPQTTGQFLRYGSGAFPLSPFDGTGPGINIVFEMFPDEVARPDDLDSQATIAALLGHELFHLACGHDSYSAENEQAAWAAEAEVICCLVQALGSAPAAQDAVDALCSRADVVVKRFCESGGTGPLANCCVNPAPAWNEIIPPSPPPSIFPRNPLGLLEIFGSSVGFADNTGSWTIILAAGEDLLNINRTKKGAHGAWAFDLGVLIDSSFDAQFLTAGAPRQLFVAGRNRISLLGELYRLDLGWSQGAPVINVTSIYSGSGFGDAVSMSFTGGWNNCVAIFDWTEAQIIRIDIMTGQLTVVANRVTYPELAEMASMRVNPVFDTNHQALGFTYHLQDQQDYDTLAFGNFRKQIIFLDEDGDDVFEDVLVISP